jgi:hypothetical protein
LHDHPLILICATLIAVATAVVAAIATRVQLLPEVIDLSLIPTGSGLAASLSSPTRPSGASSLSGSAASHCWARSSAAALPRERS